MTATTATGLDVAQQATAVALLEAAFLPLVQQFRQTVYALAVLVGRTPESLDVDLTQPIFHGGALRGQVAYSMAHIDRRSGLKSVFSLIFLLVTSYSLYLVSKSVRAGREQ